MNVEMVVRNLQIILAPVVMVTACGLILNSLLPHYATINDRLRALARERLDLLYSTQGRDAYTAERLEQIDVQIPQLLRRHKLIHDAALCVYLAVLVFLVSMFVIAAAALAELAWTATVALVLFLVGTAVLLVGIVLIAVEVRASHNAIKFEAERVGMLKRET